MKIAVWRASAHVSDKLFQLTSHLLNQQEVIVLTGSPGTCRNAPGFYRSRWDHAGGSRLYVVRPGA